MPIRGSMLFVSSGMATISSASGSTAMPSTIGAWAPATLGPRAQKQRINRHAIAHLNRVIADPSRM